MKLLIIRFSSIGDIVLTSPVVRIAKNQLNAEVHFLTKAEYKAIISENPYIDKIKLLDNNKKELIRSLKAENYDYIIDLHNNTRTRSVKIKLRKPSFTVNKENIKKWLMVNFKAKYQLPHIVQRYVDTLSPIGGRNDNQGLDFFYKKDHSLTEKFNLPKSYICVSLGAQHYTKKIPVNILNKLLSEIKQKVVLIGGKDVIEESKQLISNNNIINLTGKTNLFESAQIIENCAKILTSDTGMMHIAAALKKSTVVLWGNTIPEFGMAPYYGNHEVAHTNFEVKDLKCRPCSKIGFNKCPKKHFKCMNNQSLSSIIETLN